MAAHKNTRQPVNVGKRHGYLTNRDAIWASIRKLRDEFTTRDIEHECGVDHSTIKNYVLGLELAGFLQYVGDAPLVDKPGQHIPKGTYTSKRHTLIRDVGINAPRVNKQGQIVTQGKARENMWRAMKILRDFRLDELVAHASTDQVQVKASDAKSYILSLRRGRYVIIVRPSRGISKTVYRCVRHTGPQPPMVQRSKQVFDPNTREVVWQKPDGDPLDIPTDLIQEGAP